MAQYKRLTDTNRNKVLSTLQNIAAANLIDNHYRSCFVSFVAAVGQRA